MKNAHRASSRTGRWLRGLSLSLALAATTGQALAADVTLRLALVNKADEPITQGMEKFAELVDQYSEGRIEVKIFDSGHLGNDRELFSQLLTGAIDLGKPNFAILSDVVPHYSVAQAGYFYDNWDQLKGLLQAPEFGQAWREELLAEANLRILDYFYFGTRQVTMKGKGPRTPAEFDGVKLRAVTNPMSLAVIDGLGANPTPIPFPELFQALNEGVADGQENPLPTIYANRFYEVQDQIVLTGHQLIGQPLVINEDSYQQLGEADRVALDRAAAEAMAFASEQALQEEAEIIGKLRDKGMTIVELTDDERAVFKKRVQADVLKAFDGKDWDKGFGQKTLDYLSTHQ